MTSGLFSFCGEIARGPSLGFVFSLGHWAGLLVILVPIGVAFIHRMNVEENASSGVLGAQYTDYMQRTKRLVPFVY